MTGTTGTTGTTGATGGVGATGPSSFYVKSRVTHPVEYTTVEATTREEALQKTLEAVDEGDSVEVMDIKPIPPGMTGPSVL
jgi:hypothetical protein